MSAPHSDTVGPYGKVLLQARWSRTWGFFIVLVTGALTALLLAMIVQDDAGGALWGALAFLLIVTGAGLIAGFRLLFRPMLMHEATEQGIVTYLKGIRYGGEGFLIPWDRVQSMELVTRQMRSGSRRIRVKTIAVRTSPDGDWHPTDGVSFQHDGSADTVHLDAVSCRPGGEDLLARLRRLHAVHGSRR